MQLDSYDLHILQILSAEGRITKSALAERINLSISPCWERVKRLEQAGVIQGYGARIDAQFLGKSTPVMVEVSLKSHEAQAFALFEQTMLDCEQVVDCVATGGGIDYILRVSCDSIEAYQQLIDQWLAADLGIERYFTYIVTKTVKQSSQAHRILRPSK